MLRRTLKRAAAGSAVAIVGVIGFASAAHAHSPTTHVVQPGETLSGIAGSNWAAVADTNGIANPNLILPGQVLRLDGAGPVATATTAAPVSSPAPASSSGSTVWDSLAQCESGGDWSISTGNGYYGGLQFSQSSWQAAGGSGNPADASREEQIRVAENLLDMQGWGAWPACSSQLGLR